jgi:predicted nucleic acid-binding Zn ribbon protein
MAKTRPPQRRRSDAAPAGRAVAGALRKLGVDPSWRAVVDWEAVAGPTIARRTQAISVERGVLLVRVATPAWAQELAFVRAELRERLRARSGVELADIRFLVGTVAPRLATPVPRCDPPATPAPDDAAIAAGVAEVADPELREALHALGFRLVRSRAG